MIERVVLLAILCLCVLMYVPSDASPIYACIYIYAYIAQPETFSWAAAGYIAAGLLLLQLQLWSLLLLVVAAAAAVAVGTAPVATAAKCGNAAAAATVSQTVLFWARIINVWA